MKIPRLYIRNGRYFFVEDLEQRNPRTGRPLQKWHPLTRVDEGEAACLAARDKLLGRTPSRTGNLPALLTAFGKEHLPGLTLGVAKEYRRMLDVIADAFIEFDAEQVIPGDVIRFLNDRFTGKATARRHYKARLSTFFSWCVLNGHCTVNPCREIKLKAPPARHGRMDAATYWKLHDALPPMGQCFLELMYMTRQRPTEIRLLRESAIGPERIRFIPTKTEGSSGEQVEILITPAMRRTLDRARSLRKAQEKVIALDRKRDPFIIQTIDGGKFSKSGMHSMWRRAALAAGIDGVTTRDVRPFALHEMERAGYDLREIQLSAAHASVTTTEGYLEQHRARISDAVLELPKRPQS